MRGAFMKKEYICIENEVDSVTIVEESPKIESSEEVEVIEISETAPIPIGIQDAFPALGADNVDLKHGILYGRDNPNQHPITAITGLREELDNIEALKTVYSDKKQQANFYEWKDENPLQESRDGFFVCICPGTNRIQKCNGKTDVLGVTVADAAFVGGQEYIEAEDGKKVGRCSTYGLVVISGIVDVRCESNIVVGDYVTPNQDGIAEKSDGNYGFLVTSIKDDNSINWATILLAQSSILSKLIANNVQNLDERMYTAEHNIVSATNIANAAYTTAKESKDNTEIDIGIIEDKINDALNKVSENTDIIDNLSNTINNASKTAAQAKAIAESAVNSAEIIRSEAVAKATEALVDVNNLISEVAPITEWKDPNSENTGASYFVEHIKNDLATKTEVEAAETNSQYALAATQKNAKEIQSLIASIDKYSIGEHSQSYGLTLEQAKSILKQDVVYIPTVDHNESTEIPIHGNGIDDISTEKFLRGYAYNWDGTGWSVSKAQSVTFSGEYVVGSTECPYWVVVNQDVVLEDGTTYDLGGLYKWEDGAWVKVASVVDNSISRAVSSIRQTANEIAAEVVSARGDASSLNLRIQNNETTVQTLAFHVIGDYVAVESWDANDKDTGRIYYAQDTKQYWYYKDGAWASTDKSYEAGLSGTMATIEQKADEDGASIAQVVEAVGKDGEVSAASILTAINKQSGESIVNLNADKINFEGFTTFLRPSDVGEGGTTSIDGGNIKTGIISADRIDADNLKVKAANVTGTLTIGQLPPDVATTADIPTDTNDLTNGAGYQTALQVTTITNDTISTTKVVAENLKVKAANIKGTLTASYIEVKDTDNNTIFKADSENHEVYASNLSSISADLGEVTAGAIKSRNYNGSEIIIWDMPEVITPDTYSDGLNYTTYEDEGYAIVAGIGNCMDENIVIPPLYNGLPVTSIAENAFEDCSTITSVNIPNSVTSIGYYAFRNCTSLKSVTIGNGVKSIGDYAFDNCTSLKSVYITDIEAWCKISFEAHYSNPLYYANNLYLNNNLVTALTLPASITSIGNEAFSECTSLTNITIPDSVTSIGTRAFRGCTSLTSVTIGNGVTSIGDSAFLYCTSLTSITIPDSVTSIGDSAFSYCTLKNITIGNGVTGIGMYAFYKCGSLMSVTIGSSVTSIGDYAFYQCSSLEDVYYGGVESKWSVIYIGLYNTSLTNAKIYYYSETKPTETGNYWHYGSDGFKISCDDESMIDSKYFKVNQDGQMIASDAYITGTIHANDGVIGELILSRDDSKLNYVYKEIGPFDGTIFSSTNLRVRLAFYTGDDIVEDLEIINDSPYYVETAYLDPKDDNYIIFEPTAHASTTGSRFLFRLKYKTYGHITYLQSKDNSFSVASMNGNAQLTCDEAGISKITSDMISSQQCQLVTCNANVGSFGSVKIQNTQLKCNGGVIDLSYTKNPTEYTAKLEWDSNKITVKIYNPGGELFQLPNSKTFFIKYSTNWNQKNYQTCSITVSSGLSSGSTNVSAFSGVYTAYFASDGDNELWVSEKKFQLETNNSYISFNKTLIPDITSTDESTGYNLGAASISRIWNTIYARNPTISTSDKNVKNTIQPLTDVHTQIFDALKPVSYKFNVSNNNRTHIGLIAQDVKEAVESAGITTQDFAGYCEWEKEDGTTGCGLRYSEFIAMCINEIQKLKKRVDELEAQQNDSREK